MTPTSTWSPPALRPHQQIVHDFMVSRPFCAAWLGVGSGKTLTTLTALNTLRPYGHILVIAPPAIARSTWIDEITKWGFPIRTRSLLVDEDDKKLTARKRIELYRSIAHEPPTMYFISQDMLSRPPRSDCDTCHGDPQDVCTVCQTGFIDQLPRERINGCDTITWPFPTVIIDEAQGFKNHASRRFKALKTVRPAITRLIELTGTPTPNGMMDLWSQMYLLDEGQALGKNITAYRRRWFIPEGKPGGGIPVKWKLAPGSEHEIYQAVTPLVISAENTQLNFPSLTFHDVHVSLDADVKKSYHEFKRELVLDISRPYLDENGTLTHQLETIVADNQAVLQSKLRQFASGTLYISTDGKLEYEVIHDKKLQALETIMDMSTSPVLVAYDFRSDLKEILARFPYARAFNGSRSMVHQWDRGEIPMMLIHPASAGKGMNFQYGGHTLVWYSLPFSLEHYEQTNGRLYRSGQKFPVTIYRLMTDNTIDMRLPHVLRTKKRVQDSLVNAASRVPIKTTQMEITVKTLHDDLAPSLSPGKTPCDLVP